MDGHLAINGNDRATHYQSGNELSIDYTLTKTIGNWTIGLGAHQQNQLNSDSGSGAALAGCANKSGCRVTDYGAGPLVGYQFGPLNVMVTYNHNIYTENNFAGDILNVRFTAPF